MRALKLTTILLLVTLLQSCSETLNWNATDVTGAMPDLEFSLTGPDGKVIESSSLQGKPVLIFFGFTSCPDVCPTTLAQLSVVMTKHFPLATPYMLKKPQMHAASDVLCGTFPVMNACTNTIHS